MVDYNKKNKEILFFFFPCYHIGGAEKVHAQIVECLKNKKNIVIFTDRSRDKKNKKNFNKNAKCYSLFGLQNKFKIINIIFIKIFASIINNLKNPIIIGSNSQFFYKLIPKLNKNVKIIDVVHWLDGVVGELALKNSARIDKRIIITSAILPIFKKKYIQKEINSNYLKKIKIIKNCVSVPVLLNKNFNNKLKVLYIGRNSYEKRPKLSVEVYEKMKNLIDIDFLFIGRGMGKFFSSSERKNVVIENIYSKNKLNEIYGNSHIIFLTSIFEGFPLVFMEAMSYGVVPISTDVGGISEHLKNGENSILIKNKNEQEIVKNIINTIYKFELNRKLLQQISINVYNYAKKNFVCKNFFKKYNSVINEIRN